MSFGLSELLGSLFLTGHLPHTTTTGLLSACYPSPSTLRSVINSWCQPHITPEIPRLWLETRHTTLNSHTCGTRESLARVFPMPLETSFAFGSLTRSSFQ